MLKFLSGLRIKPRPEILDARLVYQKTMQQSRNPAFYGPDMFADSYDGRMEVLCAHLAIILHSLRKFGENGKKLSQALYDVMVEDFDVALREEGLSDTGVSRRIKPLAKMFFGRVKVYGDILSTDLSADAGQKQALFAALEKYLASTHKDVPELKGAEFKAISAPKLADYVLELSQGLAQKTLGDVASGTFSFPEFK